MAILKKPPLKEAPKGLIFEFAIFPTKMTAGPKIFCPFEGTQGPFRKTKTKIFFFQNFGKMAKKREKVTPPLRPETAQWESSEFRLGYTI